MKIVYIGAGDGLADAFAERMTQEGAQVCLLGNKEPPKRPPGPLARRFYRIPRRRETFEKLLRSIAPNQVVFAGNHYIGGGPDEAEEDLALLGRTLNAAAGMPGTRFILLSSVEVYGGREKKAGEAAPRAAAGERGMRFIREEQMAELYHRQLGLDTVILRASQPYGDRPREGGEDLLSRAFTAAVGEAPPPRGRFQPLHVSDLADAVKRAGESGRSLVYNVCGGEISGERLYSLACRHEGVPQRKFPEGAPEDFPLADSGKIRRELGWSSLRDLEAQLQGKEIRFRRAAAEKKSGPRRGFPAALRRLLENLLLFALFFALWTLCGSHALFSRIDWLTVYVVLVSIAYSVYQSTLAAGLASAAFLYSQHTSVLEANTFYASAGSWLAAMQFVFLALMVSYTANMLRENLENARRDYDMLKEDYDDLNAIDQENVLIKNEYEERLLASETGFPRLYSLVSRLMVLEPERILMETMQVVSELVRTDTVAVYRGQAGSPWLRLMAALSDSSAMEGKTWNLSGWPRIYDAVKRGELCQGKLGSEEPAAVLPIVCRGVPEAVILVKTLPYECETLYHANLLKTLSLLLRDSMEKALQYEELSRAEHYVGDTDILKPEAFLQRVQLAREKARRAMAEYCVVELVGPGPLEEAARTAGQKLRVTDCMGTDGQGRLFALLNNTGGENLAHLQERLQACGVEARSVQKEPVVA